MKGVGVGEMRVRIEKREATYEFRRWSRSWRRGRRGRRRWWRWRRRRRRRRRGGGAAVLRRLLGCPDAVPRPGLQVVAVRMQLRVH